MIRVKWLEQTSDIGCPSMWVGETDDGKPIYIRWRWGELRAVVGNKKVTDSDTDYTNILGDCKVIYFGKTPDNIWINTKRMEKILEQYFIF